MLETKHQVSEEIELFNVVHDKLNQQLWTTYIGVLCVCNTSPSQEVRQKFKFNFPQIYHL